MNSYAVGFGKARKTMQRTQQSRKKEEKMICPYCNEKMGEYNMGAKKVYICDNNRCRQFRELGERMHIID